MGAFFSGTDDQELIDNAVNHQIYLSLIVNYANGGSYVARIAWAGKIERKIQQYENHFFNFFKKKNSVKRKVEEIETEDVIFYTDIPIEYLVDNKLKSKYEELSEVKTFTSTIANRYSPNTNNVRQLSVDFNKVEDGDFGIPSFILEKKDEDFPFVFYRNQAERINQYWESTNYQTSFSFSKEDIDKFLTTLVTANKKDTRSFWQLNNAQTNMSVAARTKLEDEIEFSFDKAVWDIFGNQLDDIEELFLCYRVLYELPNTIHKKPLHEIIENFFTEKEEFLVEAMYEEYMESPIESIKEETPTYTATSYGGRDSIKCTQCKGKGRIEEGGYRGICYLCFGDGVLEADIVD